MARRGYPVTFKYPIAPGLSDGTKEMIANYVKEQVLEDISQQKSSVSGNTWQGLSPEYAAFKANISGEVIANLELYGNMLDSFGYKINEDNIEIGIFGDELQQAKAENHNYGVTLPRRQFIPDQRNGETFRPEINNEVESMIIASGELETTPTNDFIEKRVSQDILRNLILPELNNGKK